QFPQRLVRHAMVTAIVVKPMAALDAGGRFQAALWVIEPAVDDLAVARGSLEPDRVGLFEDDDLFPRQSQRPRRGEADHPGAHHYRFDFVHCFHPLRLPTACWPQAPPGRKRRYAACPRSSLTRAPMRFNSGPA